MKIFLPITVAALMALPAMAESFTVGEYTYLTTSETTVELSVADITEGAVAIPETVVNDGKTYTVTSIGENVFMRKQITAVDMPNTITRIGTNAFQFCMQLEKVHLSENLEVIGTSAFQTTRKLAEINWPASLKSINSSAFLYSTSYAGQIWLPKGISVDDNAFDNMNKASSLWLDGQPSEWGDAVCNGCSMLTELYVNCMYPPTFDPSNTFPIDEWGWDDPTPITLYVPIGAKDHYLADAKWVTRFEDIVEMDMANTDMTNPSGSEPGPGDRVYETYTDTWSADNSIAQLNVATPGSLSQLIEGNKDVIKEISLSGKINGSDILVLREMAGSAQDGSIITDAILEKIDLYNCEIVEGGAPYFQYNDICYTEQDVVGKNMFTGCYSVTELKLPKYATSIGSNALADAAALSVCTMGDDIESIGELAFYNCRSLESLELPDRCNRFGNMVFYVCSRLKHIKLPESLTVIPFASFYYCQSLKDIALPSGIKRIEDLAFHNCTSLESIYIPAATNTIDANAFGMCESLKEFNIDDENADYTDIDGVLFNKNRSKLHIYPKGKDVSRYEIPAGTISVETNAMSDALFTELIIPEGVISMLPGSASYCKNLERIEIPASLNTFDNAFESNPAILNYVVAENNPVCADIDGVLTSADKTQLLKYPVGRSDAEYTVPTGITEIGEQSFLYANPEHIIISEGVTEIGINAFAFCENLSRVDLPSSMQLLREGSFAYTPLTEIYCEAIQPPVCEYFVDEDGTATPFVQVNVAGCTLYVPYESIASYTSATVWSDFNITSLSGVHSIDDVDTLTGAEAFTIDGKMTTPDAKGFILIRTRDGRTVKVINK